jgi:hypothetical protein
VRWRLTWMHSCRLSPTAAIHPAGSDRQSALVVSSVGGWSGAIEVFKIFVKPTRRGFSGVVGRDDGAVVETAPPYGCCLGAYGIRGSYPIR